jgi:ABC-type phosphate transport system auxiliary subunit
MIASQDDEIKSRARAIPGTPVLSIHGRMLMLESPSDESRQSAQHRELKRRLPKLSEVNQDVDESESSASDDLKRGAEKIKRKKRKMKGANPLSCLPKKVRVSELPENASNKKRVRSKRKLQDNSAIP